jgi:hypothetical protein
MVALHHTLALHLGDHLSRTGRMNGLMKRVVGVRLMHGRIHVDLEWEDQPIIEHPLRHLTAPKISITEIHSRHRTYGGLRGGKHQGGQ